MWLVIHSVYRFILHFIANVGSHTFPFIAHIYRSLTTLFENGLPVIRVLRYFLYLFLLFFYDFIDTKESIPCEKKGPETSQQKL